MNTLAFVKEENDDQVVVEKTNRFTIEKVCRFQLGITIILMDTPECIHFMT